MWPTFLFHYLGLSSSEGLHGTSKTLQPGLAVPAGQSVESQAMPWRLCETFDVVSKVCTRAKPWCNSGHMRLKKNNALKMYCVGKYTYIHMHIWTYIQFHPFVHLLFVRCHVIFHSAAFQIQWNQTVLLSGKHLYENINRPCVLWGDFFCFVLFVFPLQRQYCVTSPPVF